VQQPIVAKASVVGAGGTNSGATKFIYMKKDKQKLILRLKIIEGQIRGLQNMLEKGTYCINIITQTSAVKQALSSVEDALMENHLSTCLINQIKKGKEKQATKEVLEVYRLKRK
jgi:CsoR family transcriptional regulator, copper-sensing transcriptional repressor